MKVREFIEWLKTQDQDADVFVMVQEEARPYTPFGDVHEEKIDIESNVTYTDYRNYATFKGTIHENDRDLVLGKRA